MTPLSELQIKEIAENLECQFDCYWNISNNHLIFLPEEHVYDFDIDSWKEELKELKKSRKNYKKIENPTSSESFEFMQSFAHSLENNNPNKEKLLLLLAYQNPFANFNRYVHEINELREKWFAHKSKSYIDYVKKEINVTLDLLNR